MGDEIQELVDLDATADRILGLLDVSDTVHLLCHGVLSRQSNEMSLMWLRMTAFRHSTSSQQLRQARERIDWTGDF
jgi:hypothetical protein